MKLGLVLLLLLATASGTTAAAPDAVRSVSVFPTPTELVLDPRNGRVFVVSVGILTEMGATGGHAGLTLLHGSTGQVLHRWPNWPQVGSDPLAGRIILRVGDHAEVLPGGPSVTSLAPDGVLAANPPLFDPHTDHILFLLHYAQLPLSDGFAVADRLSGALVHQQKLIRQLLEWRAVDDVQSGAFVLAGCSGTQPCTLWVVDARTGKVTDKGSIASVLTVDSMAVDAQRGRLLLYDFVGAPPSYRTQIQLFSMQPLRLLRTIPLPHPYGAVTYGVLGQGIGVDEGSGHALVLSSHALDVVGSTDTAPGTARLIDTRSGRVLKTAPVGGQPATVVVDSMLHRAYVADAMTCDISVIDMRAERLVARVRTGHKFPVAELVDTNTGTVFVINQIAHAITMFNAATTRMDPSGC